MNEKKILIVLPAYNAAKTLAKTIKDLPNDLIADIILIDDASDDNTVEIAKSLNIETILHKKNSGYGANQKTCYNEAIARNTDIVVMLHPDCQYDPRAIETLILPIKLGICDVVLGNRIRSRKETLSGGMPLLKYIVNRILTFIENITLGQNLGDFHSGYRAYSREVLEKINFKEFSDDFVFDSELLAACAYFQFKIGDVPVPTIYFPEASQINFTNGVIYSFQTLITLIKYLLQKTRLFNFAIFQTDKH
jgi:glycosyltransferase involved in cell wall biosynthesis